MYVNVLSLMITALAVEMHTNKVQRIEINEMVTDGEQKSKVHSDSDIKKTEK